jgi:hypothetical protein
MDVYGQIKETIRTIAGATPTTLLTAQVTKVEGSTCTVKVGDLELTEVRLRAVINSSAEQLLITPKVGSYVLLADLSGGDMRQLAVVAYSEVAAVSVKISATTASVDKDGVVLNGGENGGLTITPKLVEQLAKMTARIDGIIDAISNGVPAPQDGGAALQASIKASLAAIVDREDFGSVENGKVKH